MNTSYPMIERRAVHRMPPAPPAGDALGLRGALDTLSQHKRLILLVFSLVFGASVVYVLLATPIYRADSLLQIESRARTGLLSNLQGSERGVTEPERTAISGEIEVLSSREMLLPLITSLGIDVQVGGARRYGFLPVGARHGIEVLEFKVPESHLDKPFKLTVEGGRWELSDESGALIKGGATGKGESFPLGSGLASIHVKAPADGTRTRLTVRQDNLVSAHEDLLKRLRLFEPSRESSVVRLSYEDSNPGRAAALLNGLVARYIKQSVQRRQDERDKVLDFVEAQLPPMLARVESAENALSAYQRNTRAAPANTESEALLKQRSDLERQAVDLRIRRDLLSQTLAHEHPDLVAVQRQIRTVEGALARLSGDAGRLPTQSRDVGRLQREVQVETQVYTAMLNQAHQLRLSGSALTPGARQLDRAAVPFEPYRPKLAAVLSIGAAAGIILAMMAALLARSLQNTISGPQELHSASVPPTLGMIPESAAQRRLMDGRLEDESVINELGTHRLLARAVPDDPAVEALRSVHLSLLLRERRMATKVIMVTSPSTGTGKAFVAANLAALMVETGDKVLLIETDLRNPGLHKLVGLDEFAVGLSDLLTRSQILDDVIHRHPSAGMDVMLQGTMAHKAGPLLLSQDFEAALGELRERYDHIIINAAPLLPSQDTLAVGRVSDFTLMVVRAEQSLVDETRLALRRLEDSGIKLDGLLFNGVKRKRLGVPALT